jgi:agmatinase
MALGLRGASRGPLAIRTAERYLPAPPASGWMHQHVRVAPLDVLNVVDYGDAAVDPFSVDNSMEPIGTMVREVAEVGAVLGVLGGDHSIMLPNVSALADIYGSGKVGVIHFDAHVDCSNDMMGHLIAHRSPVRRLIEDKRIAGTNFIQVGLPGFYPDDALFAWMREHGLRSHFMAEIEHDGFVSVMEKAIAEALDGSEYLYISVDIDVLDEVVPGLVEVEVAVPRSRPAVW